MKRVKLIVAYDGTEYSGWQIQPNGITIEEVLNRNLSELLGEEIHVTGASRTDAGVHSLGNIAIFDTDNRMPAEKISFALNQRLPEDIVIQGSDEVAADWHPRYVKSHKTYEYQILNRTFDLPTVSRYAYHYHYPLDEKKMQQAAELLVGEHDFTSFASPHSQVNSFVRTLNDVSVSRDENDLIHIRVTGNGFLYNMVRIIAGTLIEVGAGKRSPESIAEILREKNRDAAGPTAPAKGLTMISWKEDDKDETES